MDLRAIMLGLILAASGVAAQAPGGFDDQFAVWAPDGRAIVFTSNRSGDPEVYRAGTDGSGLRRLTETPGRDAHPYVTPDGRRILFQSPRHAGHTRLFSMALDGSDQRLIARTTGFCGVPAPSPDGRRIALMCSAAAVRPGGAAAPWRLYLVNADGSGLRAISDGPGNDQVPNWGPDGRSLVFFSNRSGSDQLHRLNLSTGAVDQLTQGPDQRRAAVFLPNGRAVAFIASTDEGRHEVRILNLDTRAERTVTSTGYPFGMPHPSPDGRRLLYPEAQDGRARIAVVDLATGERRLLAFRE